MLVPLLATVAAVYAAFVGWCGWRIRRRLPEPPPARAADLSREADLPRVAVLVAARDEDATLARCLDALLAQDYPPDRLAVIVADDHSTDGTAEIVRRYEARTRRLALAGDPVEPEPPEEATVRYVRVPDPASPLRGKALAIHTAIQATDQPIVLITDADCAPAPGWVRGLAEAMGEGVGLAAGMTLMDTQTAFEQAQSLDWGYLLGVASALTEAGLPGTAMGNNLAVRREAYEAVGGYPGLRFSVTEDHALYSAIARTPWRVRFPVRPQTLVRTVPARDLTHAYRQRRRWARGGLRAGPTLWGAYVLAYVAHAVPLVGLAVAPGAGLAALAVKLGADAFHLSGVLRQSGAERLRFGPFLLFQAWVFFYMSTLPLALLIAPRIRWKGRVH